MPTNLSPAPSNALPLVDWIKALASQLILLHHFFLYGAMSDVAGPALGRLGHWLIADGRLAVQCFLVVGGYLAMRSLLALRAQGHTHGGMAALWGRVVVRRTRRLVVPLWVAILLAVLAAALARQFSAHPSIPGPVEPVQLLANLLLLQDILGIEAVSAGIWYVAIDLQLFALLAVLVLLPGRAGAWVGLMLFLASVFVFNRQPTLDAWAPYFFASYVLGVGACVVQNWPPERPWTRTASVFGVVLVVVAGLLLEWRIRLVIASAIALMLLWPKGPVWRSGRRVQWLAAVSYPVFLLHYPVLLVVDALYDRLFHGQLGPALVGMAAAWAGTLWLAERMRRYLGA